MTDSTTRKNTQKLQRAIVDGLEDVKAQHIVVFNTEHLSPLFERVVVASGTSNRQTKALASSVRDAVREAGFPKPRTEGEENGEWIIVDCGTAVVHIMQPAIRQYYNLEEIWGDKPVHLKGPASRVKAPAAAQPTPPASPGRAKKPAGGDSGLKQTKPIVKRSSSAIDSIAKATPAKTGVAKPRARVATRTRVAPAAEAPIAGEPSTKPGKAPAAGKRVAARSAPASATRKAPAPAKKAPAAANKAPAAAKKALAAAKKASAAAKKAPASANKAASAAAKTPAAARRARGTPTG